KNRGKYPGLPQVLNYLDLPEVSTYFKTQTAKGNEEEAYEGIKSFLKDGKNIHRLDVDAIRLGSVRDEFATKDDAELKFLLDILPRFEIEESDRLKQITQILSEDRQHNGLNISIQQLCDNPYLLCEKYVGNGPDDQITFAKIDH